MKNEGKGFPYMNGLKVRRKIGKGRNEYIRGDREEKPTYVLSGYTLCELIRNPIPSNNEGLEGFNEVYVHLILFPPLKLQKQGCVNHSSLSPLISFPSPQFKQCNNNL